MEEHFEYPALDDQQMADLKIQPGEYPFEVAHAELKFSKNGNSMIVLQNRVFDNQGKVHNMTDYLVSAETMVFKIKHFWESVGHPDKYNGKNKISDYVARSGYCRIAPQKNKLNDTTDNKIVDYIVKEVNLKIEGNNVFEDEDIPF